MASQAKLNKIHAVLNATIREGETNATEWKDIVAAINETKGLTITNWLTEVRGVLQWMINEGKVKRTAETRREAYYKI